MIYAADDDTMKSNNMAHVIQISQTKFDELLNRISRLEKMMVKLLERTKSEEIPMVDEETEKMIGQSLEDLKKGRYTVLDSNEKIEKHFDSL